MICTCANRADSDPQRCRNQRLTTLSSFFFRRIMNLYARTLKFREPVMLHPERMTEAYRQFQEKKIRLIVGFRHAYGDDPQLMAYTFHRVLPRAARKIGQTARRNHACAFHLRRRSSDVVRPLRPLASTESGSGADRPHSHGREGHDPHPQGPPLRTGPTLLRSRPRVT